MCSVVRRMLSRRSRASCSCSCARRYSVVSVMEPTLRIAQRPAADTEPSELICSSCHAILDIVGGVGLEVSRESPLRDHAVVRMYARAPARQYVATCCEPQVEQLGVSGRDVAGVVDEIQVPDAVVGRVHRQVITLFADAKRSFRLVMFRYIGDSTCHPDRTSVGVVFHDLTMTLTPTPITACGF